MRVKEAIVRLRKQNKPIRERAKTLRVASTTVWNILKKEGINWQAQQQQKAWKTTEDN